MQDTMKALEHISEHPGHWHPWPLSYPTPQAAQQDIDRIIAGRYGHVDPRRFYTRRAHDTFLDKDGRFHFLIGYDMEDQCH